MTKTYIMKLSAPEIIQVKMCTNDGFMQFFSDIYPYPDHMEPIEDEEPKAADKVKMFTIKKDDHVYSIFKIWGDEYSVALFEADIQENCRRLNHCTLEIKNMQ